MEAARADRAALTSVGQPADTAPGEADTATGEADRLAELVSAAARGLDEAFAELYDATSARVYGLILRVLRSADHADEVTQEVYEVTQEVYEVTQEVYLEMWQQSARYDPGRGSVLAWMITMAHRRAVDRVRRSPEVSSGTRRGR